MQGVVSEAGKMKEEGNRLFGRKDYSKALDAYEKASKITAADAKEERAALHSNKAACHLMLQRYRLFMQDMLCTMGGVLSTLCTQDRMLCTFHTIPSVFRWQTHYECVI